MRSVSILLCCKGSYFEQLINISVPALDELERTNCITFPVLEHFFLFNLLQKEKDAETEITRIFIEFAKFQKYPQSDLYQMLRDDPKWKGSRARK